MLANNMPHAHPSPSHALATVSQDRQARPRRRWLGPGLCALLSLFTPDLAEANPGVSGTRNLSMGNATRGSSTGTDAALINPAGIAYSQQFEIEPIYQFNMQTRTHGFGVFVSDSLNSPRIALALGYMFTRGSPRVLYNGADDMGVATGERDTLEMVNFGHEVSGTITVVAVKNWLYFGLTPSWQYLSLRYLGNEGDSAGVALDYRPKHNVFGLDAALALNIFDYAKVAVVGYNLVAPNPPARDTEAVESIDGIATADPPNFNLGNLPRLSDYPRSLGHGLAIFPLGRPGFSINVDATYDFTSYWDDGDDDKWTRITVNGGAEFIAGPVPIRVGGWWDSRDRGGGDDRGYVSGGLGFIKPAALGGVGVDVGVGFAQQVAGSPRAQLDTILSFNVGLRLRPDL